MSTLWIAPTPWERPRSANVRVCPTSHAVRLGVGLHVKRAEGSPTVFSFKTVVDIRYKELIDGVYVISLERMKWFMLKGNFVTNNFDPSNFL